MIIWHQKMSLFPNLLFPKNLHYPSCKSAYSKYKARMESARAETVSESREKKRKILINEIANVKRSKVTPELCITTLYKDADALSREFEIKQDPVETVKLVAKSSSFRKAAIEKEGYFRIERINSKVWEWLEKCIDDVISDKFAMNNHGEA